MKIAKLLIIILALLNFNACSTITAKLPNLRKAKHIKSIKVVVHNKCICNRQITKLKVYIRDLKQTIRFYEKQIDLYNNAKETLKD